MDKTESSYLSVQVLYIMLHRASWDNTHCLLADIVVSVCVTCLTSQQHLTVNKALIPVYHNSALVTECPGNRVPW